MTFEELLKLLKFIYENNGWGEESFYPNSCEKHRNCFKYVDFTLDTRDGKIFSVLLRDGSTIPNEKLFRIESEKDIEKLYKFLNNTTGKKK